MFETKFSQTRIDAEIEELKQSANLDQKVGVVVTYEAEKEFKKFTGFDFSAEIMKYCFGSIGLLARKKRSGEEGLSRFFYDEAHQIYFPVATMKTEDYQGFYRKFEDPAIMYNIPTSLSENEATSGLRHFILAEPIKHKWLIIAKKLGSLDYDLVQRFESIKMGILRGKNRYRRSFF